MMGNGHLQCDDQSEGMSQQKLSLSFPLIEEFSSYSNNTTSILSDTVRLY